MPGGTAQGRIPGVGDRSESGGGALGGGGSACRFRRRRERWRCQTHSGQARHRLWNGGRRLHRGNAQGGGSAGISPSARICRLLKPLRGDSPRRPSSVFAGPYIDWRHVRRRTEGAEKEVVRHALPAATPLIGKEARTI